MLSWATVGNEVTLLRTFHLLSSMGQASTQKQRWLRPISRQPVWDWLGPMVPWVSRTTNLVHLCFMQIVMLTVFHGSCQNYPITCPFFSSQPQASLRDTRTTWRLKLFTRSMCFGQLVLKSSQRRLPVMLVSAESMRANINLWSRCELYPNMRGGWCWKSVEKCWKSVWHWALP